MHPPPLSARLPWPAPGPLLAAAVLLALAGCSTPDEAPSTGDAPSGDEAGARAALPSLWDLEGREVDPVPATPPDAVRAFVFVRTDCPIANRYAPELARIHEEFAPRGVSLRAVYCDPREDAEQIRRHQTEYSLPLAALRDPEREFALAVGATLTPEAVVFRGERMVYRGRIDDQYLDFNRVRSAPTVRDLREVLDALCDGQQPAFRTTTAVGCPIPPRR